ncbi:PAS domain S-box protein [Winogradskyella poriferorum]|uniref:histidine kinase n=1 Tax=Winogradskyella poriferorum TaxID=307627 RepID=A0ABU7W5S9_9FLAO
MEDIEKKVQRRYFIFVVLIVISILASVALLQQYLSQQKRIADLIDSASGQIMNVHEVSEKLKHIAYNYENPNNFSDLQKFVKFNDNFFTAQEEIHKVCKSHFKAIPKENARFVDSLFTVINKQLVELNQVSSSVLNNFNSYDLDDEQLDRLVKTYEGAMRTLIDHHNIVGKEKLNELSRFITWLAIFLGISVLGGFGVLLIPALKQVIDKNKSLRLLKDDLQQKEKYNKIFIEQSPNSIAMLDKDMKYIAVSEQWLKDYKLEDKEVIGFSHYDVFPEIGKEWKAQHQRCLNGAIDKCDEAVFVRADGTVQWIFWDVRPWYASDGSVGGLLMYTGDITKKRQERLERQKIGRILRETKELSRIGTWEVDLSDGIFHFGSVAREILGLREGEQIIGFEAFDIYKPGISREKARKAIEKLMKQGTPFDLEFEIINKRGETKYIREIGKADFEDVKVSRIYGIFQDITASKEAELTLLRQNEALNFAEQITKMGHWQWNVKTNELKWSSSLYKIFNLSPDSFELSMENVFSMTHPDDRLKLKKHMEETMKNKKYGKDLIHRIICPKGNIKHIRVVGRVILDEENEISEIIGTNQDVTQQVLEEAKFKALLESAPDAMVIVNEDKIIQIVNTQAELMFGYKSEELIGVHADILVPSDYKLMPDENRLEYLNNAKGLQEIDGKMLYANHKNGHKIPVQISLSPLETEDGLLVSATMRDITEQIKSKQRILDANEHLKVLTEKLQDQNVKLKEFAHITSHNLRAPISNLTSLVELYHFSDSIEDKNEIFNKLEEVTERVSLTLDTLAEALKVKNNSVEKEILDLETIYKSAERKLQLEIANSNAKILTDFRTVIKVEYNKQYLQNIFENFISNAIRYASKERQPELLISAYKEENKTILSFKDNGLGMDLEKYGHKLFGLHKVFHRHPEAKGVGLFITKMQVEAMGGNITVKSAVNEGTEFIVTLS